MAKSLNLNGNDLNKIGSFIGFEDSSDSESDENVDIELGGRIFVHVNLIFKLSS